MKSNLDDNAVEMFAAEVHNAWRRQMLKDNPSQRGQPRMRLRGDSMVDVNQPWSRLHRDAKLDNRQAARDALAAVQKFPTDREAAAEYVHELWIKRNSGDLAQPVALMENYGSLSELEKNKDREHVDRMQVLLARSRGCGG